MQSKETNSTIGNNLAPSTPILQEKGLFRIIMAMGEMTAEKWLMAGAAVATIAFLAVAVLQPSLFDADPDWGVSEGCIGGQTSHTAGEDIGIKSVSYTHLTLPTIYSV